MILNVQFWEGDKKQAMTLARLIADLQPEKRDDVYVLFTARFDATHDSDTIKYVGEKFPVITYTTKRKATGWPNGPNQMMACSYEHIILKERADGKKYGPVMFIEADCVPLAVDWIDRLIAEYKASGKMVIGAWLKKGDAGIEHINGNCIISTELFKKCKQILNPQTRGGWDATCAYGILPNAAPSRLIWSDYQLGMAHNPWKGDDYLWEAKRYKAKDNPLYGEDLYPVWLHGVKVPDGIKAARKRLLNESSD